MSSTSGAEREFDVGIRTRTCFGQRIGHCGIGMIETTGLRKKFGDFVAVHNLNLHVPAAVIFGLLGPNGSGKSTTVRMLTGILKPSAGDALIDGSSLLKSPLEIKQKIGVLPEDLALFDSLTIWEHLKLCGPIYGLSRSETESRAEQLLNYLDLWSVSVARLLAPLSKGRTSCQ